MGDATSAVPGEPFWLKQTLQGQMTAYYDQVGQWAFNEFSNVHTAYGEVRDDLQQHGERHNAEAQDIHALFARMWDVEQRLEAAEGRLATVAAEVTQMAVIVNRAVQVAQSAKSQARTNNRRVTPPPQSADSLATDLPLVAGEPCLRGGMPAQLQGLRVG